MSSDEKIVAIAEKALDDARLRAFSSRTTILAADGQYLVRVAADGTKKRVRKLKGSLRRIAKGTVLRLK